MSELDIAQRKDGGEGAGPYHRVSTLEGQVGVSCGRGNATYDPAFMTGAGGVASSDPSGVCAKMEEEESIRVVHCGGSELNFRRAVFSADSKYEGSARGRQG